MNESHDLAVVWMEKLSAWWCNLTHDSLMWPIHGHYECGKCGRRYPVMWEKTRKSVVAPLLVTHRKAA